MFVVVAKDCQNRSRVVITKCSEENTIKVPDPETLLSVGCYVGAILLLFFGVSSVFLYYHFRSKPGLSAARRASLSNHSLFERITGRYNKGGKDNEADTVSVTTVTTCFTPTKKNSPSEPDKVCLKSIVTFAKVTIILIISVRNSLLLTN